MKRSLRRRLRQEFEIDLSRRRVLMFHVTNGQVPIVAGSLSARAVREWRGGKFVDEMIIKGTDLRGRLCVLKRLKGEHSVTLQGLQNQVDYYNAIQLPNVRFWDFGPGVEWMKLTLRPGERITNRRGNATDEGWIRVTNHWEYCVDDTKPYVKAGYLVEQSDCDGRHEHASEKMFFPHLLELREVKHWMDGKPLGFLTPQWFPLSSSQRDHTAEAAGY